MKLELELQLPFLKSICKEVCYELTTNFSIHDAIKILSKLPVSECIAFSCVCKVFGLLLVLPANATSQRSLQD